MLFMYSFYHLHCMRFISFIKKPTEWNECDKILLVEELCLVILSPKSVLQHASIHQNIMSDT